MADKVLIIHSGGIGDLLLALPAMRMFRAAFALDPLELFGRTERLGLVAHDLRAGSIHSMDRSDMAYLFLEGSAVPRGLSDLLSSFRIALVFGKPGSAALAANLKKSGIRPILIPPFPSETPGVHVSDFLMDQLRKAGIQGEKDVTPLKLADASLSFGKEFLKSSGPGYGERTLAIHPGSGSRGKNWHPKRFAEVADWASGRAGILLILGPAEEEIREIDGYMIEARAAIADEMPLVKLAGVLKTCSAYVGNDSGITHLAAALGVPTIAVFGPTDPFVWGPWGPKVTIISASGKDRDPTLTGPKTHQISMEEIDPERVIQELETFLGSSPA